MKDTKIEWCHSTFNPWIGCTKVSPGCMNCYAETLNNRMKWTEWGPAGRRVRTGPGYWNDPIRWNAAAKKAREAWEAAGVFGEERPPAAPERPRVFCASLADWLDPDVPGAWRSELLALIEATPELDWLLLTKRPENWQRLVAESAKFGNALATKWLAGDFPANVWLGVSAENQFYWDLRVGLALKIPARVRFVSAEPLLGGIVMGDLRPDWVIVGGESGPGARNIALEWVESFQVECEATGTPFFFKQWGGVNKKETGRELHDMTYSQFPTVALAP